MPVVEWLRALEQTRISEVIRESAFPYVEGTHVLGLSLSVGMIAWVDLRLLGATMRSRPVSEVYESVKGVMLAGFGMMFVTGALLFAAHATKAYESVFFRAKVALMLLAGVNALVFHWAVNRQPTSWNDAPIPPTAARISGLTSLVLWLSVIAAGRLFAYDL
jgi:peptidoglycan/LPS O-acetylase OafA/YrhL